jgi:hypothetical protein
MLYGPCIPSFFRAFIMKRYWIVIIMWFLSLFLFMLSNYIYWFLCVEPFLYPWNETKLIMVCDLSHWIFKLFISKIFSLVHLSLFNFSFKLLNFSFKLLTF